MNYGTGFFCAACLFYTNYPSPCVIILVFSLSLLFYLYPLNFPIPFSLPLSSSSPHFHYPLILIPLLCLLYHPLTLISPLILHPLTFTPLLFLNPLTFISPFIHPPPLFLHPLTFTPHPPPISSPSHFHYPKCCG